MNVQLKDMDRLKSSFLATVSHELRTPLTSIIGYSEMLSEGLVGTLNQEQTDYVRTIMEKGDTLLKLISSILDVTQIEAGKVRLTFEPVNVGDLVSTAVSSIKPQAQKKGLTLDLRLPGRAVEVLSLAGLALPGFWVAIILAAVFAVSLRIFPATGYVPPSASVSRWLWALTLPVIALGLAGVASVAKQTRDSMKDTLAREYIRTLRASGIGRRSIIWKHALRNGAIPVVTVLGLVFVSALSSTVFVEAVFVLPGLGSMAVTATSQHDIPVIEGIALYFTVLVVIVNVLLDIVYGMLNPKVRRS